MNTVGNPRAVRGLHHLAWRCNNAEVTRRFYEDVLGLPLVHVIRNERVPSTGEYCPYLHIFFRMRDGSRIAFFDLGDGVPSEPSPNTPAWVNHIALRVDSDDDLRAMQERLHAANVETVGITDHDGYIHPNGLRLELTTEVASSEMVAAYERAAHGLLAGWNEEKARA